MKRFVVSAILVCVFAAPLGANAATPEELMAQIQGLLSQLSALKSQANQLGGVTVISGNSAQQTGSQACPNLQRNLARGAGGPDVRSLQQYMIALNLLPPGSDSGFFGPLTEKSVQKWQTQHGIVTSGSATSTGWGSVGMRTRTALTSGCYSAAKPISCPLAPPPTTACAPGWRANTDANGCTTSFSCSVAMPGVLQTSNAFSASPVFGVSPLVVTFVTKITNPISYAGGAYQIEYGDTTSEKVAGCASNGVCSLDIGTHLHTYNNPGTYTARLIFINRAACASGVAVCAEKQEVVAGVTITVGMTLSSMSIPATSAVTLPTTVVNPSTLFSTPARTITIPVSTFSIPATTSTPATIFTIPSTTITIPATISTTSSAPDLTFTIPGSTLALSASTTSATFQVPSTVVTVSQGANTSVSVQIKIPDTTITTDASSSTPATSYTVPGSTFSVNPTIN